MNVDFLISAVGAWYMVYAPNERAWEKSWYNWLVIPGMGGSGQAAGVRLDEAQAFRLAVRRAEPRKAVPLSHLPHLISLLTKDTVLVYGHAPRSGCEDGIREQRIRSS
jgi:hypothetical protein